MIQSTFLRLLVLIIILACTAPAASAQSYLEGTWSGSITQYPKGLSDVYDFQITLITTGDSLYGTSTIVLRENPEKYGIMAFTASWDGAFLDISETNVIEKNLGPWEYWCIKTILLNYEQDNGIDILEGSWDSSRCGSSDGEVYLERVTL